LVKKESKQRKKQDWGDLGSTGVVQVFGKRKYAIIF
jgi:hypothetical protein